MLKSLRQEIAYNIILSIYNVIQYVIFAKWREICERNGEDGDVKRKLVLEKNLIYNISYLDIVYNYLI